MSSLSLIHRMLQTIKSGIHKKLIVPWDAWQKHALFLLETKHAYRHVKAFQKSCRKETYLTLP